MTGTRALRGAHHAPPPPAPPRAWVTGRRKTNDWVRNTGHPIPGLPFAADSHIPLDDLAVIEAIGRHPGGGTRGRDDLARPRGRAGWVAYTGYR